MTRSNTGRRLLLAIVSSLAVGGVLLTGCSSSGSGASNAKTGSTVDVTSASASKPAGTPVKIMVIGSRNNPGFSEPELFQGAQAEVDAINESGGVSGHPLDLIQCDSNLDPNQEQACIDQAVSSKISAIVGSTILFSSFTKLEAANIPLIGVQGLTPEQFQSPISYPFAGEFGWLYGEVAMAKEDGIKKAAIYSTDIAAAKFGNGLLEDGMKRAGISEGKVVEVANSTTDYTAAAAAAMSGNPDGIFTNCGANNFAPFAKAVVAAGYTGKIYTLSSAMTPDAITALGSAADGIRAPGLGRPISQTGDPTVTAFLATMKKYQSKAQLTEIAQLGYSGALTFATVMKSATSFAGSDVIAALNQIKTPITAGPFGPFVGAGTSPLPAYPRLLNYSFIAATVKDGKTVASSEAFTDAFKVIGS